MTAPRSFPQPEAGSDARLMCLLETLGLRIDVRLDVNEDFLTLRCHADDGELRVLKYCCSNSPDALRRLRNEALLTRDLKVRPPLRLLHYRAHGDGYMVTAFEAGAALGPQHLGDPLLMPRIADALAIFQSLEGAVSALDVRGRESRRRFLLKVLTKHLLHLWPRHLGLRDAYRAWSVVRAGLDDIDAASVPCHADLLPTNMLRDAHGDDIVLIDLEGFILAHHPLYDVLSFFTVDARPLEQWDWQAAFLARWRAQAPAATLVATNSAGLARAYRALLAFLLVYRYNETRINEFDGRYFDGGSKAGYVLVKLAQLLSGVGLLIPRARLNTNLAVRRDNLRHALDSACFATHLAGMLGDTRSSADHAP